MSRRVIPLTPGSQPPSVEPDDLEAFDPAIVDDLYRRPTVPANLKGSELRPR
jgi:hypothetical protein